MQRICILCGKPAEIENFCSDCWLKKNELFSIEDFEITVCDCGSYYYKGEWRKFEDLEDLIEQLVRHRIKTENKIIKIEVKLKKIGTVYKATIKAEGYIPPCEKVKEEEKQIRIKIRKRKCERCVKILSNYYEAVFQVRRCEIPTEISNIISDYVTRIEEKKDGYDIFLIDKKVAKKAVKELKELGFKIKVSYKFVGMKKGKRLYRDFYFITR